MLAIECEYTCVKEQSPSASVAGTGTGVSLPSETVKEIRMTPVTTASLRPKRERINAFAKSKHVRYVLVSRDAVNSGVPAIADSFGEEQPAMIAAKFPEEYSYHDLEAFRRGLSVLIGHPVPVVSFDSLPRSILEHRLTL